MQLNLKNDMIFKTFFTGGGSEKYLKEFLESLLEIEIEDIIIKKKMNLEELFLSEKGDRVNCVAIINKDTIIDIELQVEEQRDYLERATMYAYEILGSAEYQDDFDYNEIYKIISINLVDFELLDTKEYISDTEIVLEQHRDYVVTDSPKWYFIELPKFRKTQPDMNDELNQWLVFIDDYDKNLIKEAEDKNPTLKELRGIINYLSGNEMIRKIQELRDKRQMNLKLAKSESEKEIQVKIAKKMLKMGKTVEEIKIITELTEEEIENLKNSEID